MSGKRGGTGGFALVEMILGIGVLALVGLVVVQMFIAASNTQNRARDLDAAVSLAQSAAETYRAAGSLSPVSYYDREWNPQETPSDDGFTVVCEVSDVLTVSVRKNSPYLAREGEDAVIYELRAAAYAGVGK